MTGSPELENENERVAAAISTLVTKPAFEIKKPQALIDLPAVQMPVTKMTIAPPSSPPASQMRIDDLPTPLYWALLATSAAILILQIWNYLS